MLARRLTAILAVPCLCYISHAQSPASSALARPVFLEKIVRQAEPDGSGRPEQLSRYLELFRQEMIQDPRLFAFEVTAQWNPPGQIVLHGVVGFEESRTSLKAFLRVLGFDDIEDRLQIGPSADLGPHRFGLVQVSHSLSYDRASGPQEVVTECLLGDPVYLLREAEQGMMLCHGAEGYLGYVDSQAIRRVDGQRFERYQGGPQVILRQNHRTADGLGLPVGARLKLRDQSDVQVTVELPSGQTVNIPAECCRVSQEPCSRRLERVLQNAQTLLGTPYLWGGKTVEGVDCSGLVQVAFAGEGIQLPRDSNQQVYLGRLTATRWHRQGMRTGDTLYFLGPQGKIRHTGLYLGNQQFLHATSPVVTVASFNPQHENYDRHRAAQFAFAKRLLD